MAVIKPESNGPCRSETILFVGAGATAQLDMPPTTAQAHMIYDLCDVNGEVQPEHITYECLSEHKKTICDLLNLLDYEENAIEKNSSSQKRFLPKCFPGIDLETACHRVLTLRETYDWHSLKLVAKSKKGRGGDNYFRENFLQEVFTLIDACLREGRGYAVYSGNQEVFLTTRRLQAAREMLILLINTMFACAWQKLVKSADGQQKLQPYRRFAEALSQLMYREGEVLYDAGHSLNHRDFYLFSYTILTTNFEPIFLWLFYQAHKKLNRMTQERIHGRKIQLFYDFPNTLGMYQLLDSKEKQLSSDVWQPMTEAVVQKLNDDRHQGDRIIRIGKYYYVHGSSNFRHCPACGRISCFLGDTWDENSESLFPPGIIHPFLWNVKPRTKQEHKAFERGEYDAKQCLFCGQLTHACDNFMFMQTQLKCLPPSFIKEITDEALAALKGARHIVLLGYRMPLDDAIWGSVLTATIQRIETPVYCSVVCGYQGEPQWLFGETLDNYISKCKKEAICKDNSETFLTNHGIDAIENAFAVFGKANVRAYTKGIPEVFGDGTENIVRELMYPQVECPKEWQLSWCRNGQITRYTNED